MSNKKYICDTNILLSSLLSSSTPPAKTVDFIKEHGIFSFSQATLSEFSEVLKRPKFDKFLSKNGFMKVDNNDYQYLTKSVCHISSRFVPFHDKYNQALPT